MDLRLFTRRYFHRSQTFTVPRKQFQFFGDCFSRTNRNNKSIHAIINNIGAGGMRGSNDRCALRHRFGNGKAESLEKRWKNQHVMLAHFEQNPLMAQAWKPAMIANSLIERATAVGRFPAQQRQFAIFLAEYFDCAQSIGKAFALTMRASEQEF